MALALELLGELQLSADRPELALPGEMMDEEKFHSVVPPGHGPLRAA
jgi:hypothetical protein